MYIFNILSTLFLMIIAFPLQILNTILKEGIK